ncbi:MAG TPA: Ig-like domain-containing protein [Thermoflexus sp.]|nr:Ig-like domain-containing protein [Thermoflexus sp.]
MKELLLRFFLCALLLSACSTPGASFSASGVQAWLDQPVNGSILPPGPFLLKAHARHVEGSGITRIEFLVNGVSVGTVSTDPAAPLVYAETSWNASTPGEYNLMARAYDQNGGFADSAPARVCVSQEVRQAAISPGGGCTAPQGPTVPFQSGPTQAAPPGITPLPSATPVQPTFTPVRPTLTRVRPTLTRAQPTFTPIPPTFTPIPPTFTPVPPTFTPVPPTFTPVPDTTPPMVAITSYTMQVGYGSYCAPSDSILTVTAQVQDDQGVDRVYLLYVFDRAQEGIYAEMTPTIWSGYYSVTIDLASQASYLYNLYGGANGSIRISVIGYDRAGNSASDGPFNVLLYYCIG